MKTYKVQLDPLDVSTGCYTISLVERPAVEINFLAFSAETPIKIELQDDEKRIITGIALLADTPIYRRDPETKEEYNIEFSKETIRLIAQKFFGIGAQNNVNLEHKPDKYVGGITLFESYLIDKERGICPVEFGEVPDGSWVVSYKVDSDDLWQKIKSGEVKGFSIEGYFNFQETLTSAKEETFAEWVDKLINNKNE